MNFLFQPVRPGELTQIVDLMNRAFRSIGPEASWNTEAGIIEGDRTSLEYLENDLSAHPEAFLLAARTQPESPIWGCVWLQPRSTQVWYLGSLAVDPRLQKSGVGRQLLEAAENWAAERGAEKIRMTVVNVRQTLIAWYERRGYQNTGETLPFPYGDNRFGTLRDDLSFVVLEKSLAEAN